MRTVRGDSDRSATRDSSAHPGRGPLVKASGGGCDKAVPLRSASVSTDGTWKGKEKLASIGCRLSTLGHWGWLLPTPKYPAGALQVTKTYPGSHKASTKGHLLPCFHLSPCRIHEAPTAASGHGLPPFC